MLLIKHAARYLLSGGALSIFGYASIILLTSEFGVDPYWANCFVYVSGVIVSYWLNARVVFRNELDTRSFLKFLFSFGFAYAANLLALSLTLNHLHFPHWLSQLVAMVMYSCVHFCLSRAFVFKWKQ